MSPFLLIGSAFALSGFPAIVRDDAGMSCLPSCMLCHDSNAGGAGTATQAFVASLEAEGFLASDDAPLTAALAAVQAGAGTYDVDGGGVNDVDELVAGSNPNPDGIDFCTVDGPPEIQRGCFAGGDSGTVALGLGVGLATLGWRRRRTR